MLGPSPPVRPTLVERRARRLICACRLGPKVRVVWPERSVGGAERGVEEVTLPGGAARPEPMGDRELQAEGRFWRLLMLESTVPSPIEQKLAPHA